MDRRIFLRKLKARATGREGWCRTVAALGPIGSPLSFGAKLVPKHRDTP